MQIMTQVWDWPARVIRVLVTTSIYGGFVVLTNTFFMIGKKSWIMVVANGLLFLFYLMIIISYNKWLAGGSDGFESFEEEKSSKKD